jgi:hypothetical protein
MAAVASREEIVEAVELQHLSYALLQWMPRAMRKGSLAFGRGHASGTAAETLVEWLRTYPGEFPATLRPRAGQLEKFANLFASYLVTSLDLVDEPVLRSGHDCRCELCLYLRVGPNLRPKEVNSADKARARQLKMDYVRELATSHGKVLTEEALTELIDDPERAKWVAVATYGDDLVRRCHGRYEGKAILALWREFAWTPAGSPKRNFELDADDIFKGQDLILSSIS